MVQPSPVKAEGKAEEILLPPPLKDITFYGALTPTTAQPFLAISGIGECKGYWIGALPVPPEEPEESDDEDNGAAAEVHKTPQELVSARYPRIDATTAPISPSQKLPPRAKVKALAPNGCSLRSPPPTTANDDSPSHPPSASPIQETEVHRIREERREIATEMARLWKEEPEQWLLKSKILWAQRHEARRGAKRSEVPTAKSLGTGRGNTGKGEKTRASGGKIVSGLPNRPGRSAVSLKMLVESGHMRAGPEALWISYLNKTWSASLDSEGVIRFEGKDYNSPSAWAIFCKRIANPGKKADDGWKSVRYGDVDGPMLDQLKQAYLCGNPVPAALGTPVATRVLPARNKRPARDMGEDSEAGTDTMDAENEPSATKRLRTGEDSGADTPMTGTGAGTPADSVGGDD